MVGGVEGGRQEGTARLSLGERVIVLDAPGWCRRYLVGRLGRVLRPVPLSDGEVWVRFEPPVAPWCHRMDPVDEFPFSVDQLTLV